MPDFADLHLAPEEGATLESLGWRPGDSLVRQAAPVSARGNNLVVAAPPSPGYSAPALAGLASHLRSHQQRALLLVPDHTIQAWERLLSRLFPEPPVRWTTVRGSGSGHRALNVPGPHFLLTTPALAGTLHRTSLLHPEHLGALVAIWPEQWDFEELLPPLMQDLPTTAARMIVTASPQAVADMITRYAWKAATASTLLSHSEPPPQRVEAVGTPWHDRLDTVRKILEITDPSRVLVWTVDRCDHAELQSNLEAGGFSGTVVTGDGDQDPLDVELLIAYDLPTPGIMSRWTAERILLLTPPGTESWAALWAGGKGAFEVGGAVDAVRSARSDERQVIRSALDQIDLDPALLDLAPLFEQYGAPRIAAALLQLWRARPARTAEPEAAERPARSAGATERLWIGAGRRDDLTPGDLVAVLTRELGVGRERIGRIDIRESYSLLEVDGDASTVAEGLTGKMVRRRRLVARRDRGPQRRPPG